MIYMQERLNFWSVSSSLYAVKAHGKALKIATERGIDDNIDDASVVNTHAVTPIGLGRHGSGSATWILTPPRRCC